MVSEEKYSEMLALQERINTILRQLFEKNKHKGRDHLAQVLVDEIERIIDVLNAEGNNFGCANYGGDVNYEQSEQTYSDGREIGRGVILDFLGFSVRVSFVEEPPIDREKLLNEFVENLGQLVELLQIDPQCAWTDHFIECLENAEKLKQNSAKQNQLNKLASSVMGVYGGMSSFSDFVLPPEKIQRMSELDAKRSEVYVKAMSLRQ